MVCSAQKRRALALVCLPNLVLSVNEYALPKGEVSVLVRSTLAQVLTPMYVLSISLGNDARFRGVNLLDASSTCGTRANSRSICSPANIWGSVGPAAACYSHKAKVNLSILQFSVRRVRCLDRDAYLNTSQARCIGMCSWCLGRLGTSSQPISTPV